MSKNGMKYFRYKLEQRRKEREKIEEHISIQNKETSIINELFEENLDETCTQNDPEFEYEFEIYLINFLNDPLVDLPIKTDDLLSRLSSNFEGVSINEDFLNKILLKLSFKYKLIKLQGIGNKRKSNEMNNELNKFKIISANSERINAYLKNIQAIKVLDENDDAKDENSKKTNKNSVKLTNKLLNKKPAEFLERLLSQPSALELQARKSRIELNELLMESTVKEKMEMDSFKSRLSHVQEYCPYGTKDECFRNHLNKNILHKKCEKIHFKRILKPHTDVSLGDCSFLNTCYNINNCKYIHYEVDMEDVNQEITLNSHSIVSKVIKTRQIPPQWIQCDLRSFDMTILGKFSVIMADPPWDIHMELPYGTMADDEMKKLDIPSLQDEGYIFLWVTGRAMELGRECLKEWNYERCDELIWVKTNQLQRIIRTGRTGHWLNHGKEHCLVGVKGKPNPELFNKGIDCDIIVAEVRATSHKPDEVYGIIERLSPGTRKVELFGRPHNIKPNWITLGNQLDGVRLIEPNIVKKFKERYPDGNAMPQITSS